MENNPNSPVFAGRYRFEPVGNDWDRGRSGATGLVYDLKEDRLGVIKRTETFSKPQTHSLQNEIKALKALKGLGVPEVYDNNQAVYDSKNYDYAVIEYIDGVRVEKNLDSLSVVERAEIITQLFGILSHAHQTGIVNGDVDLKHLFWSREKKQLVVIDWGNTKLDVDPRKKTEFAYDLARAAEIIFSLVTRQGHPLATGSIALPDASALVAGLGVLPIEFQNLCKWAPRTPSDGVQAPYTARELFEVSKKWLEAIGNSKPYKQTPLTKKRPWLIGISFLGVVVFLLLTIKIVLPTITSATSTATTFTEMSSQFPSANTPTEILTLTVAPSEVLLIPTETPVTPTETPVLLSSPLEYSALVTFDTRVLDLIFDTKVLDPELKLCWVNEVDPPTELVKPEGFNRKIDETWWVFNTGDGRTNKEAVMADFGTCSKSPPTTVTPTTATTDSAILLSKSVKALALNTWVTQLKPGGEGAEDTSGGEFGIFLKAENGSIRGYTLWVDKNDDLHLRIREDAKIIYDDTVLVVNVQYGGRGNVYRQFRIQMFLELDNNGSAIIYLLEADSIPVQAQDINPNQMIRIDTAVLPKMDNLQGFGLIGRGGSTQVLIWPLVLLGK